MTLQTEILNDEKYLPVLNAGFIGLIDHMGSDEDIASAARVSYAKGTKTINDDKNLIRYLIRHAHTSPIEMVETKWHIKLPIFVSNQFVRHRTASLNQVSYRYSLVSDEFYMPDDSVIQPQSTDNKQGRNGQLSEEEKIEVKRIVDKINKENYIDYLTLTNEEQDPNKAGIARELARIIMPMSLYTEMYWKIDLHNLFHFLRLRCDPHAQYEIRVYADAMVKQIKKLFPIAVQAWEDYSRYAVKLSFMDSELLRQLILVTNTKNISFNDAYDYLVSTYSTEDAMRLNYNMSKRELTEFKNTWNMNGINL